MGPDERTLHTCKTFIYRKHKETLKKGHIETVMRFDLLMIVIGLLLLVAMTLTLLFGREYSRHGYGAMLPAFKERPTLRAMIA
jgi:hypothetical protein